MNIIDALLILIVLLAAWSGWHKGFLLGALELIGWIGSLLGAFWGYHYVASFLDKNLSLGLWTLPAAFILTLTLARTFFSLLINRILSHTPLQVHQSRLNKALGVLPGLLNGLIYAVIAAALLLSLPLWDGLSAQARNSKLADQLAVQAEWADEKLSPIFDKAIQQTLNKLTVHPDSEKEVRLPFQVRHAKVRPDLEEKMLELVNNERQKRGLPALKADPELTKVARAHAQDMFARGYFAHETPEGKTPFDRMQEAHIRFLTAGENLALGHTLSICHEGLMNSPGHRANILNKAFGRLGIGILDGGLYGLMISQEFRN